MQTENREHFGSLDGLRAFAAIGILVMHVKVKGSFELDGILYDTIIPSFTHFTLLFMMLSAFGMCCGYYKKILENKISVTEFYSRRYQKIWPYFAILVLADMLLGFSKEALLEAFANLTLVFALLPNFEMSVLGVSWTLGVIFLFYMLFPFFCFLLKDKKTAWFTFAVAVLYQIACVSYFMDSAHVVEGFRVKLNFLYCAEYFVAGGILYLYRDKICRLVEKYRYFLLVLCVAVWAACYLVKLPEVLSGIKLLVLFSLCFMYAIGTHGKILNNRVMRFLSSISMELYLCHFGVLRVAKKLGLAYAFGTGAGAFWFTTAFVLVGSVLFSVCARWMLSKLHKK